MKQVTEFMEKYINIKLIKHMKIQQDAKWLVTTGAIIEKSQRPLHVMPETNRSVINHQPIGGPSPVLHQGNEKDRVFVNL